jgi:tetratricopeptide (TPR) repeat protein
MGMHAYEEAAAQYRRALQALKFSDPDEPGRCELLLRLGAAQARAGNYQEAKESCLQAAEISRRLGAAEQLARAALGFGERQVEGGLVNGSSSRCCKRRSTPWIPRIRRCARGCWPAWPWNSPFRTRPRPWTR